MKKHIPIKNLMLGIALFGTSMFAANISRAADIIQIRTIGLGTNWNNSTVWGTSPNPGGNLATAGNNYISGGPGSGTYNVRTYDSSVFNASFSVFAGDKLVLTNNGAGVNVGSLVLKNGGAFSNINSANIELGGGTISQNTPNQSTGATGDWRPVLGGTILVTKDSLINLIGGATANRDTLLLANISGSANLTVAHGIAAALQTNSLVLLGTNTAFSGNWTNTFGRIEIGDNALNALGTGRVMLMSNTSALRFNATNNFALANPIDGVGSVVKLNTNTVTLSGVNTFTGSTVISNGVLKLSNASAISTSTNISLRGGTVDASLIGGLTLNTANSQSLDCNGSVTGSLTVGSVNALNLNVTAATNDILNVSGALTLGGTPVTLNVSAPLFKAAGTYRLINYVGAAIPTNNFNLVVLGGTSQSYALSSSANQLNLVVVGAPKNLTWLGGGIWDTTSLNWTNSGGLTPTNFAAGDSVTFNDSASDFFVEVANSTLLMIPASLTVSNAVNDYTIYGDGIAPTGTLTKKGSGTLILTSPSNSITGTIDIQAGTLSVGAGGGFGSLGNPSSITNNGKFMVNLSQGGPVLTGPISGTGQIEVLGPIGGPGGVLTLSGSNTYTGFTTINDGCQLYVGSSNALGDVSSGTRVLANGKARVRLGWCDFDCRAFVHKWSRHRYHTHFVRRPLCDQREYPRQLCRSGHR